MKKKFVPAFAPPKNSLNDALCFVFHHDNLLLRQDAQGKRIPSLSHIETLHLEVHQKQYLGKYDDQDCYSISVNSDKDLPKAYCFTNFRMLGEYIESQELLLLATRARQILFWDGNTKFCGRCGGETKISSKEPAKVCVKCETFFYPQISPVVMVLIAKEDEILLARSPHFPEKMYSVIAGFVEPGETIEHAAMREVLEEVGVQIKNLTYISSQPWAFPSNLMIGFIADYDSGDIKIDEVEIEHADWFQLDDLPKTPTKISLGGYLIAHYLEQKREKKQ